MERLNNIRDISETKTHRVHFLRTAWFRYSPSRIALRWASAAAILIIFGIGAYLWNNGKKDVGEEIAATHSVSDEVLPGGNKAVLTLSDGTKIVSG